MAGPTGSRQMSIPNTGARSLRKHHSQLPLELPFIVSISSEKADPVTRKLIRSHVMRGKNRVKPSKKSAELFRVGEVSCIPVDYFCSPGISRALGSKFAAVAFAADVEQALVEDVLRFASISSHAMFLLDSCIEPSISDVFQIWFSPMLFDPAYLYTACFTIQNFFDGWLARTRSANALQRDRIYYAKTIRILQDRLSDNDSIRLSDSTILTVLTLSGHAYSTGDYKSAENHVNGLLRLVSMRGVDTFFHNTRTLIEIIRSDLSRAIDKCTDPILFTETSIPWPLMLTKETCWGQLQVFAKNLPDESNHDLADSWAATLQFCMTINMAAVGEGSKISEETFLHHMGSITYRLLHQRFQWGSLDEAVRLALLAFLSPVFLNWNRVELPDRRFNENLRDTLASVLVEGSKVGPSMRLWLLMIGALSMCHESDFFAWLTPWLQSSMNLCNITSWNDTKALFSTFPWIGLVYDKPGEQIFNAIYSQQQYALHAADY